MPMHLDKYLTTNGVVGRARECIRDYEYVKAICRLVARYPDPLAQPGDAILASACRDIANHCADQTLNPETDR